MSLSAAQLTRMKEVVGEGSTRPMAWRREQLNRLSELVQQHETEVLEALAADLGKPPTEAFFELVALRQELKLTTRQLGRWMRPQPVSVPLSLRPGQARVVPEPLGCVLVIGPWNYPFQLTLRPLISALAAGNTAVLKPSEHAGAVADLIARLIPLHFEADVVQVVQGDGAVAAALVAMPFDHIFFTGGGTIGRKVLEGAAAHLTPVTLELGGKSPAIVLEGAEPIVSARRLIWGKGINAGQTCIAPDHLLLAPAMREPLLKAMAAERSAMYGDDPLASDQLSRIINDRQFTRLEALLTTAQNEGRVLIGGEISREQRRIAPTVIRVDSREDPLMADELFGPLLPVLALDDLDTALQEIRQGPKPLALYLFGGNEADQQLVLNSTSSGGVCLNDVVMQAGVPQLPFGGVGASGMGCYHGESGFNTFSHRKAVLKRPFRFDFKLRYPPYKVDLNLLRRLAG
ncbi:MAG: aldehyde dehydrogenase family protein [Synechococcus sp. MED650]|nr:aldehyde dehydrogenase family protein [Synechococcus sp. MED650]OUW53840.1 MAG: aldehyde dehydrogenase family protein [Cyanobacteria bacterium TMED188]